ncbi:phosphotransferase family protein [Mycolicibacterium arenosum]|uniref:Phosphotransferase family protein n=1 Tax=Mycolicibacterium arenosum TaxID=2952157 RepID=A0ABT1M6L6_9MYCO|nr:phosphotransferase family protein [Mycolicibacterium sp. CAU 1645]MCP9274804.1 phosphotransferase family protein [Mycolicibacterium sp. CAU 1645]
MTDSDLDALRSRLAGHGVVDVVPLAGGASSLTYRGDRDGAPVVVKVAPPGHAPVGHRDVLRQARILDELSKSDVPVPVVLARDEGSPPLFVMTLVEGDAFEPLFDRPQVFDPDVPQRYREATRVMAALHRVRPPLSEPVVDATAEVDRWCATLGTVDAALVPGWTNTADALRSSVPAALEPSIVHGDFRLGNLLAEGARIKAVIDWEIWSLGDSRIDLGWFLINANPATYQRPSPYTDAVPTRAELLECYGNAPDIEWFMALACFKSAATWSLIVKHNRRRATPRPELEAMAPVLTGLLRQADELLA